MNYQSLWIEKYRPHCIDDIVMDADSKNLIKQYCSQQEIPNILLVGNAGIGKTSLARIIVHDQLKCQFLYINASDESGIDTIRNKVIGFAQTKSLDGKIKIVLLDECDGLTDFSQRALRNVMEEYAKHTRFILTANYEHRIIPALQSRCQTMRLKPDLKDVVMRCCSVLKQENIKIQDADKPMFIDIIKASFPDIRKTIGELQRACVSGEFTVKQCSGSNEFSQQLLDMLKRKQDCMQIREFIIANESQFSNDYPGLLKSLLHTVYADASIKDKQVYICNIAEHMYRSAFVMDQETNAFHCIINITTCI